MRNYCAERPSEYLSELKAAYLMTTLGWEDGLIQTGMTPVEAFQLGSPAIYRAFILQAGIPAFLDLLAETIAMPDPERKFGFRFAGGQWVPLAAIDQGDDFLLQFAEMAEAAGEVSTARFLLSARADLTAYKAFLERNQDASGLFSTEDAVQYSYVLGHQTQPPICAARPTSLQSGRPLVVL